MADGPGEVRAAIRRGEWTRPTAGLAPGFAQANLVALPEARRVRLPALLRANPRPCPLLEVLDPGAPEPAHRARAPTCARTSRATASTATARSWTRPTDASDAWRDDLVAFLIGCSFTFERALLADGLPVRHVEQDVNVPMYRTPSPAPPPGASPGRWSSRCAR